ncbi:MAG: hypothetical protein P4L46_26390 [Fimbriimonas sp.]|nr:hypothetical protein [Fimbriimonas sp.]
MTDELTLDSDHHRLRSRKRLLAAVVCLTSILVFSWFEFGTRRSVEGADPAKVPPHSYEVDLLTEEACSDGQVVQSVPPDHRHLTYRCTSQDAAAAWVSVRDVRSGKPASFVRASAEDDAHRRYVTVVREIDQAVLICLERGFSTHPGHVSVKLEFGRIKEPVQNALLTFSRIASPVAVIQPPVNGIPRPMTATFLSGPNTLTYSLARPLAPGEHLAAHVLATTYCQAASDSEGLPNEFVTAYGGDSDAIKVRLDRYRLEDKEVVLHYRNARIAKVDGFYTLILPTDQIVGVLGKDSAVIRSQKMPSETVVQTTIPHASLNIVLENQRKALQYDAGVNAPIAPPTAPSADAKWTFLGMSPRLDDLGLAWLALRIRQRPDPHSDKPTSSLFAQVIRSSSAKHKGLPMEVPSLDLRFRIRAPSIIDSTTAVLPLHYKKKGPMMIRVRVPRLFSAPMSIPRSAR